MPEHEIRMTIPETTQVINADVRFTVWSDGARLGDLLISKGSIDWRPANHSYLRSLSWENFASVMEERG